MLGVTLRWTGIHGGVEILLVASCHENRDKFRPDGPSGSYAETLPFCIIINSLHMIAVSILSFGMHKYVYRESTGMYFEDICRQ